MPESDTYASSECHGAVFDLPCPTAYAPTTEIEGNLLVRSASNSSVGGNVHIEGPCSDDGCHPSGNFNFTIDGNAFSVNSAGPIALQGANSDGSNQKGSDVLLKSGDGINPIGGTGGDVSIRSGAGSGGKMITFDHIFHFKICSDNLPYLTHNHLQSRYLKFYLLVA